MPDKVQHETRIIRTIIKEGNDSGKEVSVHVIDGQLEEGHETFEQWLFTRLECVSTQYILGSYQEDTRCTGKVTDPPALYFELSKNTALHKTLESLIRASIISHIQQSLTDTSIYKFSLAAFFQWSTQEFRPWINDVSVVAPQVFTFSNNTRHPVRSIKPPPGSVLYSRYISSLKQTFSLRVAHLEDNLNDFHNWHNSERVAAFWGEKGDLNHHREYLERQLSDPHTIPTIGYFDDDAFAYFEIYWAKEDHIAPFANAQNWDRGFHALVGNEAYRGPARVEVWITSISHYLFLADPRTQRVMLEPRVDNTKFINYLLQAGFVYEKAFNFPHKRAALISLSREYFFECSHPAC